MEEQRFPMCVRLTGVMHKDKHKMYITSVLWSDQSDVIVYRTLREFRKLHKRMKKAFPAESKLKKSDRIIPKFKVRKTSRAGGKKGSSKSLKRLRSLQKYCNELLSCDPRVSHCGDLVQFLQPKDQELLPDFSKNSIIIMPTDDELGGDSGHFSGSNITQPFVPETYRCVAAYETKDTKNKPFKVATDERVDVLIKDKAGWWLVENEDKRMAWFPAPYLEKLDDDEDDETDGIPDRGTLCTAIRSYKATKADEISVSIGMVVEVLQKSDNGWWLIRYRGQSGYVPSMYLQSHNSLHMPVAAHHQGRLPRSPASSPSSPSSSLGLEQSHQLSLSYGNLLRLPSRSPSPSPLRSDTKQRSRSLDLLSEPPPAQPAPTSRAIAAAAAAASAPARHAPPPTIRVEMDGEDEPGGNRRAESVGSLVSCSSSSDLSFSDDPSSSSASSTFNLSPSASDEPLRLSRTPPPAASNRLSPTSGTGGKLLPSVSDPNLYKGASVPRVPPRPRPTEILTRCTTITRKNASRSPTPTPPVILSQ